MALRAVGAGSPGEVRTAGRRFGDSGKVRTRQRAGGSRDCLADCQGHKPEA